MQQVRPLLIWYHFHLFISVEELHLLIFALALKAIKLWRLYASSYHKDIDFKVIYSIDPYIPCCKQWKQPYPFLKCTFWFWLLWQFFTLIFRCVIKMDHHCPWINTCCGHFNHANFTYFLFFAPIGCIHAAIILICSVYRALNWVCIFRIYIFFN